MHRPGGRAVLELGWRVAEDTETHQAFGAMWIWNETDARRMVEDAGFDEVSVTYDEVRGEWTGPVGLLHRLLTLEGMRIVRGTKSG